MQRLHSTINCCDFLVYKKLRLLHLRDEVIRGSTLIENLHSPLKSRNVCTRTGLPGIQPFSTSPGQLPDALPLPVP